MSERKANPEGSDHELIAQEVARYLQSTPATQIIESKVIEYALERKVAEVLKNYWSWRVAPFALALAAGFAYFGWDTSNTIELLRTDATARLQEQEELQRMLRVQNQELANELGAISELRASVRAEVDRVAADARAAFPSVLELQNELFSLQERGNEAAQHVAVASTAANVAKEQAEALQSQLNNASEAVEQVLRSVSFQARMINAGELANLFLNENGRAGVELPRKDGGTSTLGFNLEALDKTSREAPYPTVVLGIYVDGTKLDSVQFELIPGETTWSRWRSVDGLDGYEYKVDFGYHDDQANDFLLVKVRFQEGFVESLPPLAREQ